LDVVRVPVLLDQTIDRGVGGALDPLDQLVDAVAVDRKAEPSLRLDLVALRHRDLAHVVAEPGDPETVRLVPAGCRASPGAEPGIHRWVLPMTDHGLATSPEAGLDERELAIPVSRLVEVHEVHVDVGPGQVAVVLRVQVHERLAQVREAADPHLCRGEGVHPRDHADAALARVSVTQDAGDRLRRRDDGLGHDTDRDLGSLVKAPRDVAGVLVHLLQHLGPVEVLAPGDEPGFQVLQRRRHRWPLACRAGSVT
jgi:hypothetical protein